MTHHSKDINKNPHTIFRKFRQGVFYEDLYEEFDISEDNFISILQRNIKGKYDYKRILSGGLPSQKQFIAHLNSRWNPLDPERNKKETSPYLPTKLEIKDPQKLNGTDK